MSLKKNRVELQAKKGNLEMDSLYIKSLPREPPEATMCLLLGKNSTSAPYWDHGAGNGRSCYEPSVPAGLTLRVTLCFLRVSLEL